MPGLMILDNDTYNSTASDATLDNPYSRKDHPDTLLRGRMLLHARVAIILSLAGTHSLQMYLLYQLQYTYRVYFNGEWTSQHVDLPNVFLSTLKKVNLLSCTRGRCHSSGFSKDPNERRNESSDHDNLNRMQLY